ncbi:phage portal protein [Streptomyces sp. NBC_00841]|uniref:phage portal protein n=1 Tax=Streptomyces sp. NBC_00841 TaxID=2975847 RepID=UPI002DDBCD8D|nr:phage portal protein [Streptomyces sp. NBC_00841]WRZ98078.1 phage portal protein [Streptomyces sp. NBC_00841]
MESPKETVVRLHAKLEQRKTKTAKWSDYYNGNRPLLFASPEFSKTHGGLFEKFSDNWCQLVPDSTVERLMPLGFRLDDGSIDEAAGKTWRQSECDVEVGLAFLEALITGRAFALVWKPDGKTTEITFQSPSNAIVEYVPGSRRKRKAGLLVWRDGAFEFATLFNIVAGEYRVYRYQRESGHAGEWGDRTEGLPESEPSHLPNPLKAIPLVELPNRSRLHGSPRSEIENVAPLQDAMNTLWAHLMTASDTLALPARAVLGMDRPVKEILDADGEVVGEEDLPLDSFRSDRLLWLEREGASIAEFSAADLTNYTKVIEVAVQHIAAQTRTPPHYLLGQMVNVSADALVAAESGLVAKVQERQRYFGAALREVMRLAALADGDTARAEALALGSVVWRDAQFRSDAQYADALTKLKAINVPDEALWERIPGVDPDQVKRWKSMRNDQAAAIVGGDLAGVFGPKPEAAPEVPQEGV